jgi:uncharacterized protein YegL
MHLKLNNPAGPKQADYLNFPATCNTGRPGMLIILLDQSESMGQKTWGKQGKTRIEAAAEQVNTLINAILHDTQNGDLYRERIWIAVFQYSSSATGPDVRKICDGWPKAFSNRTEWIDTKAAGGTPMVTAFEEAREYIQKRFSNPSFRNRFAFSPPPVVLNITDGEAGDGFKEVYFEHLMKEVLRIRQIETPQGFGPIVFHVHITDAVNRSNFLPASREGLDSFGRKLFQMADQIPDAWVDQIPPAYRPEKGAVGLVTNGNPEDLGRFLFLSSNTNPVK